MNRLNLLVPALVFIILVLCFGWLRQCESAKEIVQTSEETEWRTLVENLKVDTANLRAELRRKAIETIQDSTKAAQAIWSKGWYIARLKARNEVQRPDVQPILDSIPKLQAFVDIQDSIIVELTDVNAELNASYKAQVRGLNEQLEIHSLIQAKNDEIMRAYEVRVAELQKQVRKENKRKRFFRTTTLILGGAVAVLILAK